MRRNESQQIEIIWSFNQKFASGNSLLERRHLLRRLLQKDRRPTFAGSPIAKIAPLPTGGGSA
jgi:hypothetical protein